MIPLNYFLSCVQQNVARITHYESAGDGSGNGGCDCIGLIIGALRLAGFCWPGVHGSNWTARNAMDSLNYIDSASDCFLGEIVYKAKEPGESGYDLPATYNSSPDRRDYYHVGVVTSIAPLCITHCTSVEGGIKQDNALGKWHWGGRLKYVNYDSEEEQLMEAYNARVLSEDGNPVKQLMEAYNARVLSEDGNPVKMRKNPSANSKILVRVPYGAIVKVVGVVDGTWSAIEYEGQPGYMMSKFLFQAEDSTDNNLDQDKLEELCELLAKANEILHDLMNKEGDIHAD